MRLSQGILVQTSSSPPSSLPQGSAPEDPFRAHFFSGCLVGRFRLPSRNGRVGLLTTSQALAPFFFIVPRVMIFRGLSIRSQPDYYSIRELLLLRY